MPVTLMIKVCSDTSRRKPLPSETCPVSLNKVDAFIKMHGFSRPSVMLLNRIPHRIGQLQSFVLQKQRGKSAELVTEELVEVE